MDTELTRVLVGVAILLLVALLPVRKDSGKRRAFLGFVVGIFLVLGLASLVFWAGDYVLDSSDESVIRDQIDTMLRDQAAGVPRNLIVIEGSSETALGVDGKSIEEQLRQAGYSATVVTLVGVGSNHLSRYKQMARWAAEVRRHGLAFSPNTRLLLEVTPGYDADPIRFIDKNKDSLRAYYYADLHSVVYAARMLYILGGSSDPNAMASEFGDLISDALTSTFKVGLLPYMRRFDDVEPAPAFLPARSGYTKLKPYDPEQYAKSASVLLEPRWTELEAFRGQEMAAAVGAVTEVDYFSVPVLPTRDQALEYAHAFCQWRRPAPCIDATDPAIYGALDGPQFHFNRDHLSRWGAAIYSRYLAQQLIAQGVVIR